MTNEKEVSRRKFIKYVGAAAVVVAGAAAGAYFASKPGAPSTETTAVLPPTTAATQPVSKVYKAAGIFYGIVTDQAWNTVGWDAMNGLKEMGWEIANSEQIYNPDVERVMREYVTNGYDFIIPWSGGYYDDIVKAAPNFPQTSFHQFTVGSWPPENLGTTTQPSVDAFRTAP